MKVGFGLYRRGNKRVLDVATKRKRVAWCREHAGRVAWWRQRGYADVHYWYLPRTRAEVPGTAAKGSVYRTRSEGGAPQFHGRKGTGYKQGRRVGVWGVLAGDTLSVAFLPAGRITGKGHATMVRKYYKHWASEYKGVFHDGETALHSPPAQAAYSAVGAPPIPLILTPSRTRGRCSMGGWRQRSRVGGRGRRPFGGAFGMPCVG